jgi:hypothetical protein
MSDLTISNITPQGAGIFRYEALQEIKRDILFETPSVRVEVRSLDFQDPAIKSMVERIKYAKLPWDKKEHLLKLLFNYFKSSQAQGSGSQDQVDFLKDMYNLIQTMELVEKTRITPEDMLEHKKKTERLVTDFLIEEERSRRAKEGLKNAAYGFIPPVEIKENQDLSVVSGNTAILPQDYPLI